MTEWHKGWQDKFPKEQQEVVIGPHRADVQLKDGTVLEIQHSSISYETIGDRECFYDQMIWLVDAREWDLSEYGWWDDRFPRTDASKALRWRHARKSWECADKPILLDTGKWLLRVHDIQWHLSPVNIMAERLEYEDIEQLLLNIHVRHGADQMKWAEIQRQQDEQWCLAKEAEAAKAQKTQEEKEQREAECARRQAEQNAYWASPEGLARKAEIAAEREAEAVRAEIVAEREAEAVRIVSKAHIERDWETVEQIWAQLHSWRINGKGNMVAKAWGHVFVKTSDGRRSICLPPAPVRGIRDFGRVSDLWLQVPTLAEARATVQTRPTAQELQARLSKFAQAVRKNLGA